MPALSILAGVTLSLALLPAGSAALPSGRSWAPPERVLTRAGSPLTHSRLVADDQGRVILFAATLADSGAVQASGWTRMRWHGDRFAETGRIAVPGGALPPVAPVGDSTATELVWMSGDRDSAGRVGILAAAFAGVDPAPPETVMTTLLQSSEFAAAMTRDRFWVARCEQQFPAGTRYLVRVRTRPRAAEEGEWRELPPVGEDEFTCAAAPLGQDGVLVLYAGLSGVAWARGEPGGWVERGVLDPRSWTGQHPRLAIGRDGRVWAGWTSPDGMEIASFDGSRWSGRDSIRAIHASGDPYRSTWCDLSDATSGQPVLAWGDRRIGEVRRDVLCVAWPDSAGWSPGSEVPGTEGAFLPTVARDAYGDVWVAWSRMDRPGVKVVHSYTSVEAVGIGATVEKGGVLVRWTLTGPARGSVWQVQRAQSGDTFRTVGEVRAGGSTSLQWQGPAGEAAGTRFRIRRPCVDERFAWTSDPVSLREGP